MKTKIALAGNPNSGKTTMFNGLTGSNQYVGNWPGVTVEKKEGTYKGDKEVVIQDLPGIYSLSPYTLEEVVSRNYLINEKPDAIVNIVDGTNLERNLYLTTQLIELGLPVVLSINMMDIVRKNGDQINIRNLSKELGCEVIETSAVKGEGTKELITIAKKVAKNKEMGELPHVFQGSVEHAIAHIEESIEHKVDKGILRWYAIKLFERDSKIVKELKLDKSLMEHIEKHIVDCEKELDDDSESIIINQRYAYISKIIKNCLKKKNKSNLSVSDNIDKIVTNRILALPIFIAIMSFVYFISVGGGGMGDTITGFTNDVFFGEWICGNLQGFLEGINTAPWLVGLVVDGIVGGVGAVLGFVPQMLILFLMLSILEECGYMSRVAFIMDRVFRKFGLSGKSFIPMLIGSGCSVPGIMASRTIEQDRDRKMTIMTTSFIPCGAKLPIIGLIAGAFFNGAWWVATSAYFVGVGAVIISGVILKKTKMFAGNPAPFVMELPSYHIPRVKNVFNSTWERGWSFIKRAGTVILVSAIVLWFLQGYGFTDGSFGAVADNNTSLLADIGNFVAPIFKPLGFGTWQSSVGTFTGLIAKENVVGTFGVLYGFAEVSETGSEYWVMFAKDVTALSGYSFLIFNLLCAPCFAAIGAIKREMASAKWTWFAIGYLCVFAYTISFIVYNLGLVFTGGSFGISAIISIVLLAGLIYLLVRKNKYSQEIYIDGSKNEVSKSLAN